MSFFRSATSRLGSTTPCQGGSTMFFTHLQARRRFYYKALNGVSKLLGRPLLRYWVETGRPMIIPVRVYIRSFLEWCPAQILASGNPLDLAPAFRVHRHWATFIHVRCGFFIRTFGSVGGWIVGIPAWIRSWIRLRIFFKKEPVPSIFRMTPGSSTQDFQCGQELFDHKVGALKLVLL